MAPQTRHSPPSGRPHFRFIFRLGPRRTSRTRRCNLRRHDVPNGRNMGDVGFAGRVEATCGVQLRGRLGAPGHLAKQRLVLGRRARGPDLILARARISHRAAVYTQMRRTRRHDGVRRSARGKGDVVAFWWPAGRFGAREPRPTRPLSANYSPACASRSVTCERYCCPARAVRLAAGRGQRTTHRHCAFHVVDLVSTSLADPGNNLWVTAPFAEMSSASWWSGNAILVERQCHQSVT